MGIFFCGFRGNFPQISHYFLKKRNRSLGNPLTYFCSVWRYVGGCIAGCSAIMSL